MGTKNQRAVCEWVNISDDLVYEWVRVVKGRVYEWGKFRNTDPYQNYLRYPTPPTPLPHPTPPSIKEGKNWTLSELSDPVPGFVRIGIKSGKAMAPRRPNDVVTTLCVCWDFSNLFLFSNLSLYDFNPISILIDQAVRMRTVSTYLRIRTAWLSIDAVQYFAERAE